jgi:hypothetical protein
MKRMNLTCLLIFFICLLAFVFLLLFESARPEMFYWRRFDDHGER